MNVTMDREVKLTVRHLVVTAVILVVLLTGVVLGRTVLGGHDDPCAGRPTTVLHGQHVCR